MITWRGDAVTPIQIVRSFDRRQVWDGRELDVLRLWYHKATWEDLQTLLPGQTRESMGMQALRMGLPARPRHPVHWQAIPEDDKSTSCRPMMDTNL